MAKQKTTIDPTMLVPGVNSCEQCRTPKIKNGEYHESKWFCSYFCYEQYQEDQKDFVGNKGEVGPKF